MAVKMLSAAVLAALLSASGSGAQNLAQIGGPANPPPTSFKGQQFVDSRGCLYLRAGFGGAVNWVARLDRTHKPICGMPPTGGVAAQAAVAADMAPDATAATRAPQTATVAELPTATEKTEGRIADYTLWLTVFTGVLGLVTCALWWETRLGGKLAREVFIASNYPKIILREINIMEPDICYMLYNGGSEATLVESWILLETTFVGGPMPRNLLSTGHNDLGEIKFAHGETKDFKTPSGKVGFAVRYPDAAHIRQVGEPKTESYFFVGAIRYRDGVGNLRRSVFRRRLNVKIGCFERTGNPDDEYAD